MPRRVLAAGLPVLLLCVAAGRSDSPRLTDQEVRDCLERVTDVHGAAGPWAVTGYRIGQRALRQLGVPRHSHDLQVMHRAPAKVQFSCVADGVQAATGASSGKLNLRVEETPVEKLATVIRDQKSGRTLTFTLKPEFVKSILNLPADRLPAAGRRVAGLPEADIFTVEETRSESPPAK
jgi:formylmethanofuran dehydrogenase subunit E